MFWVAPQARVPDTTLKPQRHLLHGMTRGGEEEQNRATAIAYV